MLRRPRPGVADVRGPAGDHLEKDHAERVEVAASVDPDALRLLGEKTRRPHHRTGLGQAFLGAHRLGDAEVRDLDLAVLVDAACCRA